jgi:beta-lactamase superfamily II metal-dependent hydrolase
MEVTSNNSFVSCYFVNVGQGTSQVVCLKDHRAIIIDCGTGNNNTLLSLLEKLQIHRIEALVLSHNDADHIGVLDRIIQGYRYNIEKVYFLADRPATQNITYKTLKAAADNGYIVENNIYALTVDNRIRNMCECDPLILSVLYPTHLRNVGNVRNNTCAIIALTLGTQKVIFSGDAPVEAWKLIVKNNGKQFVQILTVPHHGGIFANSKTNSEAEYDWFFDNVKTQHAIVSVGFTNSHGHPRPEIIRRFVDNGANVLCTQSNKHCNESLTQKIENCCGTITATIGIDSVSIQIDKTCGGKEQFPNPLCSI